MTKETYYDMCEQMHTDPNEGEIPISYEDLCNQSKDALSLFGFMSDSWDSMNGTYLGKDLSTLKFLLELTLDSRANWLPVTVILMHIISIRVDNINKKMKQRSKLKKKK